MSRYVQRYQDLEVYKRQREVSKEVFELSLKFPSSEKYSLADQIRRSSRSIGAQIAEAWGKRLYPKHFASKLTDADSEQLETQHWLLEAKDCGYLTNDRYTALISKCEEVGRMLQSMIQKANSFAGDSHLKEDPVPYLTKDQIPPKTDH